MAELIELDVPPELDKPVTLKVDATGASQSEEEESESTLTAFASSEDVENAEIEVNEEDPKKFTLTFKPPKPDKYSLTIKWGDDPIPGSPFYLDLRPPIASNVKTEPPKSSIKDGQSIGIGFDCSTAGRGELVVSCHGKRSGDIPTEVSRRGLSFKYDMEFTPHREDNFKVTVTWSGKKITGSPFQLDLIPVNAKKVKTSEICMPQGLGGPVEMTANTEDAGNAKLEASCIGSASGNVPVHIKEISEFDHLLSFQPPDSDIYTLSILFGTKPINNSPFLINTMPPDASKVKITEPDNPEIGQQVCYKANTLHAGFGSLSASCEGKRCGDVKVDISNTGPSEYDVSFTPERADEYSVKIHWSDVEVPGSPFELPLLLPPDANQVKVGELHVPSEVGTGDYVWLMLDCTDAGHGEVMGSARGNKTGDVLPIEVESVDLDKFRVKFLPEKPDMYSLYIMYGGNPIRGSPFSDIDLRPGPNPKLVKHLRTDYPSERGEPVSLTFNTEEAGVGEFRARVASVVYGSTESDYHLLPDSEYEYEVTFVPQRADTYLVDVYWSDTPVTGSPFYVEIVYPDKVKSDEPQFVNVLHPVRLGLDTSEAGPGKLTATCQGEKCGDVEVEITQNSLEREKYTLYFHPIKEDLYYLSVFFGGTAIPGSPFEVDLRPIEPTKLSKFVGDPLKVTVEGDSEEELTATAVGETTGEAEITVLKNDLGTLDVIFDPKQADKYTVEIKKNEKHVSNSPYLVDYTEIIVEDLPTHPLPKPFEIFFNTECSPNAIRAHAIHDDTCNRYVFGIGRRNNGRLKLILKGELPGIHSIHAFIDNKEVHGSPYQVRFVEFDPSACKVIDVPEVAYLGEETSFKVDARKAGKGDLHIMATVPSGGRGSGITHQDHNNGFYSVLFIPNVTGMYRFHIKWADTDIPNSLVQIQAVEPDPTLLASRRAASKVYISNHDKNVFSKQLHVSTPACFNIVAKAAGEGKLMLKAKGPGEAKIKTTDHKDGTYSCEVKPAVSGRYLISILWNDLHIPGSPHLLDFTEVKSYMIGGLDLENECFYVNTPLEFRVFCGKIVGKLEVTCDPPNAANTEIKPVQDFPDTYLCQITPLLPGNHEISMKFNEEHILNSPYSVQFDETQENKNDEDETEDTEDVARPLTPLGFYLDMQSGDTLSRENTILAPVPQSKEVSAEGPGLGDGFIGQEGNFTINTVGTGDGNLEVQVEGPKGTFKIQLRRHPDNDRIILARYDPIHVGKYNISILWCDTHIAGSPYTVYYTDQKQEIVLHEDIISM